MNDPRGSVSTQYLTSWSACDGARTDWVPPLPDLQVQVCRRGILTEQLHAGVCHDDIGAPALGDEHTEGRLDRRLVGDVHHSCPSGHPDLNRSALRGYGIPVGDHHTGALAGEARRDGVADAGGGAVMSAVLPSSRCMRGCLTSQFARSAASARAAGWSTWALPRAGCSGTV